MRQSLGQEQARSTNTKRQKNTENCWNAWLQDEYKTIWQRTKGGEYIPHTKRETIGHRWNTQNVKINMTLRTGNEARKHDNRKIDTRRRRLPCPTTLKLVMTTCVGRALGDSRWRLEAFYTTRPFNQYAKIVLLFGHSFTLEGVWSVKFWNMKDWMIRRRGLVQHNWRSHMRSIRYLLHQ